MPGVRTLYFKDPGKGFVPVELIDIDADHALRIDPDNWRAEKPAPAPIVHGELPALPKIKKDSAEK